ncbi:type I restriction endonuclease subunit R, partial [Psychrobacter sp. Cmf 22.2]
MTEQSEYQLEDSLMTQMQDLGYERVTITTEAALLANLKTQIVRANQLDQPLSDDEWKQVISHLGSGSAFERAKKLRDKFNVKFDDGSSRHIQFFWPNADDNIWQLSNQIMVDHSSQNGRTSRFDVTILVNGLPLVQIELKRRGGIEIAEAFHQTMRYSKAAYKAGHGLFEFVQLFVISNGANTRYYAKGTQHFNFTFPWADSDNKPINEIVDFAEVFLTPTHLTEMIAQFVVLYEYSKTMMVLRPYQVHATKRLIERATASDKNGYIWHTTGSGKTLTSFKASQIIMGLPDVEKVVFVVDRNDLDTQTANEFNAFKDGSVDSTTNTKNLVKQLGETHDKLIVTTIQKLNRAIKSERHQEKIRYLQDKKVVFIFDECHRSQFGETHRNIKRFFQQSQMFGFTGTPILIDNAHNKAGLKLTTAYLFDECLHRYTIVDAIRDRNVLPFQIDYVGKFTKNDSAAD